jgi:hypothetical protein
MSQVKFEKETVRATTGGKEDFMHNIGEALTKSSGPNGYLAVSIYTLLRSGRTLSRPRGQSNTISA